MKKKKGISLIVLVITIIVMIILASAVIITLSNTNIINKAKDAVEKNNTANNKYLSEIKLAERKIEKVQGASQVKDAQGGVLRVENKDTDNEIYYIESIDDLVAFSESVNGGNTYEGKIVKLTQLLDFNSDKSYVDVSLKETVTTGKGFTPIGTYDNPFKGTFDGDGTEIRNLYINDQLAERGSGLFEYVTDATIKNIGLTGKILSEGSIGSIVVACNVENKDTYIQNCYSKVNIESKPTNYSTEIAGIVCWSEGNDNHKVYIHDCYNLGNISGEDISRSAGLVTGAAYTEINRCYNRGNINVKGISEYIAGIAGDLKNSNMYNVYNEGNIVLEGTCLVSGIVAWVGETSSIYNIYNVGNVVGDHACVGLMEIDAFVNANVGNGFNLGELNNKENLENNLFELLGSYSKEHIKLNLYYISGKNQPIYDTDKLVAKTLSQIYSQAFVDELNENIKDMPECVKWKLGDKGYPVLDM